MKVSPGVAADPLLDLSVALACISPVTSNARLGALLPIPNLLVVSSQKKFVLSSAASPVALANITEPLVSPSDKVSALTTAP